MTPPLLNTANALPLFAARRRPGVARSPRQRGVALVTALILLIVITLLGLAAVRGTAILQKLTGNFYDREMAFQAAEAGLQAAAQQLGTSGAVIARNCGTGATACFANPFDQASTLPAGSIQTVPTGTGTGQFTPGVNAPSGASPQYVIENMGSYPDMTTSNGSNHTANVNNYGAGGGQTTSIYYRITARSADPAVALDRAVVYLQAIYKQN